MTLTRGERFKDARLVHNQHGKQTMDEVEAATGIKKSLIQALENDESSRDAGYAKVATLAAHYRVSTDYLLGLTNDPFPQRTAADDLGLSSQSLTWLKSLAGAPDNHWYTSNLSKLLEMPQFHTFLYSLFEYTAALEATKICSDLLSSFCNDSDPYPTHKTYIEKLEAATKDMQNSNLVRLYLKSIYELEKISYDTATVMDTGDDDIQILDIMELKVKRNLDTVIRTIENN